MPFYISEPQVRDAIQWTGRNYSEIWEWINESHKDAPESKVLVFKDSAVLNDILIWIKKSNRFGQIHVGGWVVREPDGNGVYPMTEEIFANTYKPMFTL